MRAAAHEGHPPGAVLRALNRAVLAETRPGEFLTAIFARLQARPGGGFELALACGGHPPPVLLDRAGAIKPLDCSGTLIGVVDDPDVTDVTADLDPGDVLLLYTDGLTEAGAPKHTLTTADVAELLASRVRGPPRRPPSAASRARLRRPGANCATTSRWSSDRSYKRPRPTGELRQGNLRHGDNEGGSPSPDALSRCCLTEEDRCVRPVGLTGVGAGLLTTLAVPAAALADPRTLEIWPTPASCRSRSGSTPCG